MMKATLFELNYQHWGKRHCTLFKDVKLARSHEASIRAKDEASVSKRRLSRDSWGAWQLEMASHPTL